MASASGPVAFLQHHRLSRAPIQIKIHTHFERRRVAICAQTSNVTSLVLQELITSIQSFCYKKFSQSFEDIGKFAKGQRDLLLQATVDACFEPLDEPNFNFEGNFSPVEEIGSRVQVEVIEGAIPNHFPIGVYIRNGPNPQFQPNHHASQLFGRLNFHWFEGDGMLHATYFEAGGQISYQNKYIETSGLLEERRKGKRMWLSSIEGDPMAIAMSYFLNLLQFGEANKSVCNTTIFQHAGRLFANAEAHIPLEIHPSTLSTLGEWNISQQWDRPFTTHPKVRQETKELAIFGFSPIKPYYMTGLISENGEEIVHTCDVGLDRPSYSHDIAITANYILILDFSLTIDPQRLIFGRDLIRFDTDAPSRVGIKPIRGDASSIQWFQVKTNYTFHVLNAYEEEDEVILYGCQARRPFIYSKLTITREEWFARGMNKTSSADKGDPNIDGALFSSIHEWRFNLKTGTVRERDITNLTSSMDMPSINHKFVGLRNRFGYACVLDHEASSKLGMPKYGSLAKIDFEEEDQDSNVKLYTPGRGMYCSEPQFVSHPSGASEDAGWIMAYVHDENNNQSEVHVLDAQAFSTRPVARIKLPQRVPYGFHGTYLHGSF